MYFVGTRGMGGGRGLVKIGWSAKHPDARLKSLQCGSPVELYLIGWLKGTPADEAALHRRFDLYRSHGEWFWPRGSGLSELLSEVAARCLEEWAA